MVSSRENGRKGSKVKTHFLQGGGEILGILQMGILASKKIEVFFWRDMVNFLYDDDDDPTEKELSIMYNSNAKL